MTEGCLASSSKS